MTGRIRSDALVTRALRGAAAGVVATLAMSAGFLAAHRAGAIGTLPPRLIVERFAPALSPRATGVTSVIAHVAYGSAAGAVFGLLPLRRALPGIGYGLLVWASSYELWVPAAHVLPPAHRDDRARALTILGAHVIYGAALGRAIHGRRS